VGRDAGDLFHGAVGQDFNPRAPCGARHAPATAVGDRG